MNLNERIGQLAKLGDWLDDQNIINQLAEKAFLKNSWFTRAHTIMALSSIRNWLTIDALKHWTSPYNLSDAENRIATVGLVMAGNIPLVGFHDILSVLISGKRLKIKMSSQDNFLPAQLLNQLIEINPVWHDFILFEERMNDLDAVIATGSNNTNRYFEYYFRNIPAIIRRNRTSVAVLTGNESNAMLRELGKDLFSYFGLGCRNVSHLFVPEGYDLNILIGNLIDYHTLTEHHKYGNCYTYQRALLLVDQQKFTDTGYCLFYESEKLSSPVSVIHLSYYKNLSAAAELLNEKRKEIQCIVAMDLPGCIPFGQAQYPGLNDYADGVDTLKFLSSL